MLDLLVEFLVSVWKFKKVLALIMTLLVEVLVLLSWVLLVKVKEVVVRQFSNCCLALYLQQVVSYYFQHFSYKFLNIFSNTLNQIHDGLLDSLSCFSRNLEAFNTIFFLVVFKHFLKWYFPILFINFIAKNDYDNIFDI